MLKKAYRSRILIALFLFLCSAGALGARIYQLQYLQHDMWSKEADKYHVEYESRKPSRGNIYGRNEQVLAASTTMDAAYVDPHLIDDEAKLVVAQGLSEILGTSQFTIAKILNGSGRGLPLRPRKVTPFQAEKIRDLAIQMELHVQALFFEKESKRNYPMGKLASHIIGYTKGDDYGDNIGVAGLEKYYDEQIKGSFQRYKSRKTQHKGQDLIPFSDSTIQATFGHDLILTIDENIQHVAEKALLGAVNKHQATGGVIIVQKTKTGEILALANVPTYDPNKLANAIAIQKRNRAVTDTIEPGSVMKIFTVAALFNEGLAEPEDIFDGMGGELRFKGGRVIRDAPGHKLNQTTLYEGFVQSSNTILVQAGLLLEAEQFHRYLKRFGFGERTGIDLPGEVKGLLKSPGKWRESTRQSIPMGYEITATAIQLVTAISAVANNGVLMKPQVVREIRDARGRTVQTFQPVKVRRVISTLAAKKVMNMMEGVVFDGGTGAKAQIKGYRIAGKTGTTHKYDPVNKKYFEDKYIASFAGVAPADDPEITIFCYIDDPENKKYGGDVVAPVFKTVAASALRTLNVRPAAVVDDTPDYELVLDKYLQQAEKAAQQAPPIVDSSTSQEVLKPGRMPNLRGLTMRDVAVRMASLGVQLEFTGSGVAVKQSPAANSELKPNQLCQVEFGPTGEPQN